jgi:radical SAM protein with 4Fe4S-binding SPASM domain
MANLFLRKEPFGGVLYAEQSGRVRFLTSSEYEILSRLSEGWDAATIEQHLRLKFDVEEGTNVQEDIEHLRNSTQSPHAWSSASHGNAPIPTLSAPLELHWELTTKCQLRCLHCYNNSGHDGVAASLAQISGVVEELRPYKLRGITVSGGEPLLHPALFDALNLMRPLATELVFATNGALVTEDTAQRLATVVDTVNISIDAGTSETFDRFRGVRGAFTKTLVGLQHLRRTTVMVVAQTVVSQHNINELDRLAELLIQEGVKYWVVRMPVRAGQCKKHPDSFLAREEAIRSEPLLRGILGRYGSHFDRVNIGNSFLWSFEGPLEPSHNDDRAASCAAGTIKAALRPDGRLVPCPLFGSTAFASEPVWGGAFLEQWRNAHCLNVMRRLRLASIDPCNRCQHTLQCSLGCRAKAFLHGNLLGADPDCAYSKV